MDNASNQAPKHVGSCHCGAVKFEADVDATAGMRCNCTVCTKLGGLIAIVKPEAFRLLAGERDSSFYEWGGKTAKRYFCKSCGISCFSRGYLEQLGGDYVCAESHRARRHRSGRGEDRLLGRPAQQLAGRPPRRALADPRVAAAAEVIDPRVTPFARPRARAASPHHVTI